MQILSYVFKGYHLLFKKKTARVLKKEKNPFLKMISRKCDTILVLYKEGVKGPEKKINYRFDRSRLLTVRLNEALLVFP